MSRIILHADLNNFFASVECLKNPVLGQGPMAVGGDTAKRHGIILAKNELAKQYGIKTAQPLWMARKLCPNLTIVPPHYDLYMQYSSQVRHICQSYTNQVEGFGLDECWMDVTGSTALLGDGKTIADSLRQAIHRELGLTASVGVSFNKVFAKLGSDLKKPDATTEIPLQKFKEIVWPLPVEALLYVGRASAKRLHQFSLYTIGDLAQADPAFIRRIMGKNGSMLWHFANGLDNTPVADSLAESPLKSVGNSTTLPRDITEEADIQSVLYALADVVSQRLRRHDLLCSTVQITVRRNDFTSYERQISLAHPACTPRPLFDAAFTLLKRHHDGAPIRLLGIRACRLAPVQARQLSFFDITSEKEEKIERVLDEIRNTYGNHTISRALSLRDKALTGFQPKDSSLFS